MGGIRAAAQEVPTSGEDATPPPPSPSLSPALPPSPKLRCSGPPPPQNHPQAVSLRCWSLPSPPAVCFSRKQLETSCGLCSPVAAGAELWELDVCVT